MLHQPNKYNLQTKKNTNIYTYIQIINIEERKKIKKKIKS